MPLNDDEAYGRLHAALLALGRESGITQAANTALEAARRALTALQIGLLRSMEKKDDANPDDPPV